uniref:Uncharacterized protein n=1 Tax=Arundo donax TaxID=35708 RepID=A0A0A9BIR9_ARUDO
MKYVHINRTSLLKLPLPCHLNFHRFFMLKLHPAASAL